MTHKQVGGLLREQHVFWKEEIIVLGDIWLDEDGNWIDVNFDRNTRGLVYKEFHATDLSFLELMKRRVERRIRALWP